MTRESDQDAEDSESVDEMLQHLPEAKQRDETPRTASSNRSDSKKERLMSRRRDAAVLASNFEPRLEELENLEKVTHRAGKPWISANAGVESQGKLPIYYRLDKMVTHKAYIEEMVIRPEDESDVPQVIVEHITDDDTYSEFNDKYDSTTYLVTGGERLDEPFPQSELERIEGGEYVDEDFSYQPAYVRQRDGDFTDF
jgi:hypothetical protein